MAKGWERALAEPERLSAKARRLVEAGENVVSVASSTGN
jgi:hypothetical protein